MTPASKSRGRQPVFDIIWPYAAFLLLVAVYSAVTLGHGFNATDEGYLMSLGQRVVDGEAPYTDFYFFRTPMSVYIQAVRIEIFGDSYTILMSRILWTFQMCLVAILISILYRRFVRSWEVLLLLTATFTVSTLLMNFCWYSYDAVMFAALVAVFVYKRWYLPAGVAAFLAFMCKQNYIVLLPAFLLVSGLLQWRWPKLNIVSLKDVLLAVAGFALPALVYTVYLYLTGALGSFWLNVFVYPRQASASSVWFVLFQNHHEIFYLAIPAIVAAVLLFYHNSKRYILTLLAVMASVAAVALMFRIHHNYIYSLVYVNYALAMAAIVRMARSDTARETPVARTLLPVVILGAVIQYAAGFNYAGVVLAYMGSGLSLAVLYVLFHEISPVRQKRLLAVGLLAVMLLAGLYHKYTYVYRDVPRWAQTEAFSTAKLEGIRSGRRNVAQIESMIRAAQEYTQPGDNILVFPDMPVLYYLTQRKNPTPVGWFIQLEYGNWMMNEILQSLLAHPPKVIFVQRYFEIDWQRAGALINYAGVPRYMPMVNFIDRHYRLDRTIGDVYLFLPKEPEGFGPQTEG